MKADRPAESHANLVAAEVCPTSTSSRDFAKSHGLLDRANALIDEGSKRP